MAKQDILPFFIPHWGCPEGCIFCNQPKIVGKQGDYRPLSGTDVEEALEKMLPMWDSHPRRYREIAFYGGSFSALPAKWQKDVLGAAKQAKDKGLIDGIRCSTRPDAVSQEQIDLLVTYGMTTVELGVQSTDERILRLAKRGHTAQQAEEAVKRLKAVGLQVGVQLLVGLPGESWQTWIHSIVTVAKWQPAYLRIYPCLVIAKTELADLWRAGLYEPLSLTEAAAMAAFGKTYVESQGIQVIRTGLQATEEFDAGLDLLAGPYAPAFGEMVVNEQYRQRIEWVLSDYLVNYSIDKVKNKTPIYLVYTRENTSKVRGLKKANEIYFKRAYPSFDWQWIEADEKSRRFISWLLSLSDKAQGLLTHALQMPEEQTADDGSFYCQPIRESDFSQNKNRSHKLDAGCSFKRVGLAPLYLLIKDKLYMI